MNNETSTALAVKPEDSLALQKVSSGLFKSGLFPNAKNEMGAFAIIEYGYELGIPPMMALKNINIISGQLACNAQLMLSLALSRGVTYAVLEESDTGAKIEFKRGSQSPYVAEFNQKDAQAAGLLGKDNWKKYPRDMYFWRAVAKGIRRVAPDAVMGLYTADEISDGKFIDIIDVPVEPQTTQTTDHGKGGETSRSEAPNEPPPDGLAEKQGEIARMLLMIAGTEEEASLKLKELTKFKMKDGKMYEGKADPFTLGEKQANVVYGKVKKLFDALESTIEGEVVDDEDVPL
ncbi:MAG: hypothetical protein ABFD82_23580 [Syntrophaceae bacterium]